MKWDINNIALILSGIGALNWGLQSMLNFNVVTVLQNALNMSWISTVVYGLIGVSGAYVLWNEFKK